MSCAQAQLAIVGWFPAHERIFLVQQPLQYQLVGYAAAGCCDSTGSQLTPQSIAGSNTNQACNMHMLLLSNFLYYPWYVHSYVAGQVPTAGKAPALLQFAVPPVGTALWESTLCAAWIYVLLCSDGDDECFQCKIPCGRECCI